MIDQLDIAPTDSIDWPGGWFVRLADGGVVFVPVTFRGHGHVALFPRHLSIVEVS